MIAIRSAPAHNIEWVDAGNGRRLPIALITSP
jgi:hypothetical protein